MMDKITKENILSAIKEVAANPELRKGRASSTYDLIYEGKDYPPKLIISIANRFATGVELKPDDFSGGENTEAFAVLRKYGFEIVNKLSISGGGKFLEESKLLEKDKFNYFITTLQEIVRKFSISKADPRIVFSCRNNQLNFIVGQRYSITIKYEDGTTFFGIITKNKLNNSSEKFEASPIAFYTLFNEISEVEKYKEDVLTKIGEELERTSSSGFRRFEDMDFRKTIFSMGQISDEPGIRIWIEKTIVKDRQDRLVGDRALGKVLWSPVKDKRGADIYKNMRLVSPGDIILHFIDNQKFVGISLAKKKYIETTGLRGTEWDGPAYLIELEKFTQLNPGIERTNLLNEKNKFILDSISKESEVFYNEVLNLRQGAYLTPCPTELFQLINGIYKELANKDLPFSEGIKFSNKNIKNMVQFDLKKAVADISNSGLKIQSKTITRFVSSLLTKPFVILTGLSGSGKTKLAQVFAMWICEDKSQYSIVPVGADWTNREPMLGFPNALKEKDYVKPDNKALELIIEANKNYHKPYFLILDEMNLSHVERYFADFLSVMESKSNISLHRGSEDWNGVPPEIGFPPNLFIIGTVNIDETTYMFSPKVLDRSNVIEFRVTSEEMTDYLSSNWGLKLSNFNGLGSSMQNSFVEIAKDNNLKPKTTQDLNRELLNFFVELKKTGSEFGYRSASEIIRFAAVINKIEPSLSESDIIDASIMQKLLPKVHGSRRKLEPVLKTLGGLCLQDGQKFDEFLASKTEINYTDTTKIKFPVSFEKILRMYNNLISNGFTSYAEA